MRTTGSEPTHPVADTRFEGDFASARPNAVWSADSTDVPTRAGLGYLAAVDLFSLMIA